MTPQLWTQFQPFQDWRLAHPDLTYEDAVLLYKAELQLFQNYQDEIRNQTINRQTQLTGDLLNLSADISTILNEGGNVKLPRRYVLLRGVYAGQGTGLAVNRGSDNGGFETGLNINLGIRKGDEFIFDFVGAQFDESDAGTYKAVVDIPRVTGVSGTTLDLTVILFLNELTLKSGTPPKINTLRFKKISDSTTLEPRASWITVTREDLNAFEV